jgi:hypothetical protein
MTNGESGGAIEAAIHAGVPTPALEVYARWWQLETYLREVVYTEMRCAYGRDWMERLSEGAWVRAERDRANAYMASADADEVLAYADMGALLRVIDAHWELFEPILPPQPRWTGLCDELIAIRNRSAHCRRPHADDRARLEQALRNLEPGAREFYRSYCRSWPVTQKSRDPLARDWVRERHDAAARLVEHCRRKYGTQFRLEYSVRPWSEQPGNQDSIGATRGVLWHVHWALSEDIEPLVLWRSLQQEVRDLLVHLICDGVLVEATFAAADEEKAIADAIGHIFDRLIPASQSLWPKPERTFEEKMEARKAAAERLPPKAQIGGKFSYFDPYNPEAVTIFGAD